MSATTVVRFANYEIKFSDSDIANPEDVTWYAGGTKLKESFWVLHERGSVVCVVYAETLQDALDIAVNTDRLDRYLVTEEMADQYGGNIYDCESLTYLGNASEPFDTESLGYVRFQVDSISVCGGLGPVVEATEYHHP